MWSTSKEEKRKPEVLKGISQKSWRN